MDTLRQIEWMGSSKNDLREMPLAIRKAFGAGLFEVQMGGMPENAKPLKGFGGASVLELSERDEAGTFRAVYTIKFAGAVYVLHCFQKKSHQGIATSKPDIALIKARLKLAAVDYAKQSGE